MSGKAPETTPFPQMTARRIALTTTRRQRGEYDVYMRVSSYALHKYIAFREDQKSVLFCCGDEERDLAVYILYHVQFIYTSREIKKKHSTTTYMFDELTVNILLYTASIKPDTNCRCECKGQIVSCPNQLT